jgi:glycosyltransferase involved in cell wall biosynthesis
MELYILRLMSRLDPTRYVPLLLVPGFRDGIRSSPQLLVDKADSAGITVLQPSDPGAGTVLASLREMAGIYHLLGNSHADLVHIHTCRPDGARKATLVSRLARVDRLVRSEHMPPAVYMSARSRFSVKPFDWMTDAIVTGSDGDHQAQIDLLHRSRRRLVRIHNAVDVDAIEPIGDTRLAKERLGLDPDVPTVSTIGRLVEQKGHTHLLDAMATVIDRAGPVNVLLAGEGPLRRQLERQAEQLGIVGHVHFHGHVDDVGPIIGATDVAAMPSLWEVLSLAALEFMSAGVPVVASTHSSFREEIIDGESGILLAPRCTGAWAEAIVRLLASPAERQRLGSAARRRVIEHFSLDRLAAEMMDLYDLVLTRGAPGPARSIHTGRPGDIGSESERRCDTPRPSSVGG